MTRLYFTVVKGDTLTIGPLDLFVLDVNPTGGTLEVVEEDKKEGEARTIKLSFGKPSYVQVHNREWTVRGYAIKKESCMGLTIVTEGTIDRVVFLPKREK